MNEKLDNFMIVGAMKAATATMHFVLDRHPQISMSRGKEINFFLDGKDGSQFEPVYKDNFEIDESTRALGEASPRYTYGQFGAQVPSRIHGDFPESFIFYQIRNPLDRMVSHYAHMLRSNRVNVSFSQAVKEDPTYLETSDYVKQSEDYRGLFGDRFHWLDFDEIKADPYKNAENIVSLLGLEPNQFDDSQGAHFNRNEKALPLKSENPLAHSLYQLAFRNHKKLQIVPKPLREFGKKILVGKSGFDVESDAFKKEVARVSEEYSVQLNEIISGCEELAGRNYDHWRKSVPNL